MEIINETQNTLLKRKEVLASLPSESNPGLENTKKSLSEKFKAELDKIAIKHVKNNFGTNEFLVEAFIYESLEDKDRIEPKVKPKKKAGA
jgi:ribosomal protein S24E